jgi:hypothetical protein
MAPADTNSGEAFPAIDEQLEDITAHNLCDAYSLAERATEQFGPCGTGWGYEVIEERFDVGGPLLSKEGSVLAHAQVHTLKVALWYVGGDGERKTITHYGHTPFITQHRFGISNSR